MFTACTRTRDWSPPFKSSSSLQVLQSGEITVHVHPCCSMHMHDDKACCRGVRAVLGH